MANRKRNRPVEPRTAPQTGPVEAGVPKAPATDAEALQAAIALLRQVAGTCVELGNAILKRVG